MAAKTISGLTAAGLALVATALVGCKSRGENSRPFSSPTSSEGAHSASDLEGNWETVNSVPQLSVDQDQFYFYWGLWRKLTTAERQAIQSSEPDTKSRASGSIVSRRSIAWTVHDCATSALLTGDHEDFYFLDPLEFDDAGELVPLREAYRSGWRYFSLANFDSTFARTDLPPPSLPRLAGERVSDWRERTLETTNAWKKLQSRRGQRGEIRIHSKHRVYASPVAGNTRDFVSFFDYRTADTVFMGGLFARFNPARWPVFYDERAHKLHSVQEPTLWRERAPLSENEFEGVLTWNWCDRQSTVTAVFESVRGDLPPPGPNRPGRTDSGNAVLEIKPGHGLTKNTQ